MSSDAFGAWLKQKIADRQVSVRKVALYSGVSPATLLAYMKGTTQPSMASLEKIAIYFHSEPDYLYQLAGYHVGRRQYPAKELPPEWGAEFGRVEELPEEYQARIWTDLRNLLDAYEKLANARGLAAERAKHAHEED